MTADYTPPEAAVTAAGESIEDDAMKWLGRDVGTVHRDDIARNALTAAAPHMLADAWDEGFMVAHDLDRGGSVAGEHAIPEHLLPDLAEWNPYRTKARA